MASERRMISTKIYECSIAVRLGSEAAGLLGLAAQRIFEMLILEADDFGRGRYLPSVLRMKAFLSTPGVIEEVTDAQVEEWIKIMADEGAVEIYDVNGQKYYSLTGWQHYQRGNWRPKLSNIPPPNGISTPEVSDTKRNKSEVVGVTKGKEEKGKEEKKISEPEKPHVPLRLRDAKTPSSRLLKCWHSLYFEKHGHEYSGDIIKMQGQVTRALKAASENEIGNSIHYLFDQKQTQFLRHDFDHFIKKISYYISLAKEDNYV